jgi:hypothetical protein
MSQRQQVPRAKPPRRMGGPSGRPKKSPTPSYASTPWSERVSSLDLKRIERRLTDRAEDLLRLLGQHIPQTRQVLRKLFPDQLVQGRLVPGRIVCTPFDDVQGQGYTFLARGSYSRLLGAGIAIYDGGGGHPQPALFCPTLLVPLRFPPRANVKRA